MFWVFEMKPSAISFLWVLKTCRATCLCLVGFQDRITIYDILAGHTAWIIMLAAHNFYQWRALCLSWDQGLHTPFCRLLQRGLVNGNLMTKWGTEDSSYHHQNQTPAVTVIKHHIIDNFVFEAITSYEMELLTIPLKKSPLVCQYLSCK